MREEKRKEMHGKTESVSEVSSTSLAASSPARSPPRRPLYFVQSPSHSHDGEKTPSFHSTPLLTPSASPRHSSINKPFKQVHVIEEEGQDRHHTLPPRCYILAFVLGFLLLFTLFSLILWGVSRPMKPKISIMSIKFATVRVQAGSDSSGVTTDMITMNSTLKFTYRNTGTFFKVHVSATPLDLSYSEIVIASGNMKEFYQSRKSQRLLSVAVMGNKIPLYGSGASLSSTTGMPSVPVPLKLNFVLRSRAYVLGKLVKPKYYKRIQCSITLNPKKLSAPIPLKNSCTYD